MSEIEAKTVYRIRFEDCIRCASCSTLAPHNFSLDEASAHVLRQPQDAGEYSRCEAARLNCPTGAISYGRE